MHFSFRLVAWFILAATFLCIKYYWMCWFLIEAVKEFSLHITIHPWTYYVLLFCLSLACGKLSSIFWDGVQNERKLLASKE